MPYTFQEELNDLREENRQLKARFDALERHVLFGEPIGEGDGDEDRLRKMAVDAAIRGDRRLLDLHCRRYGGQKRKGLTS